MSLCPPEHLLQVRAVPPGALDVQLAEVIDAQAALLARVRRARSSGRTMTAPELAELLGVSSQTVYDGVKDGTVPGAVWIGRLLKFDRPTIERWLSNPPKKSRRRR